jgi:hypothetical protein
MKGTKQMWYTYKVGNFVFELQEIVFMWKQSISTPSTVGMSVSQ